MGYWVIASIQYTKGRHSACGGVGRAKDLVTVNRLIARRKYLRRDILSGHAIALLLTLCASAGLAAQNTGTAPAVNQGTSAPTSTGGQTASPNGAPANISGTGTVGPGTNNQTSQGGNNQINQGASTNSSQAATVSNTANLNGNVNNNPLSGFQILVSDSVGYVPPIFGTDLFLQPPSTFAPLDQTPVPADYVIGPGDTLQISTTGLYAVQLTLAVDRNGNINYPGVGLIPVTGVHFAQLQDYLTQQIGRIFRGFNLTVSLGSLRSIQVYVFGQARRPGLYTISSLSTLLNAVFASGGPLTTGSLRDIQLKRGDRVVVDFDVYDLLLRGDKTKDVSLQPGDIIYIPPVGPQVALLGSVTTPAIYELRGETTLNALIGLGSGLSTTATGQNARLERILEHRERSIVDVTLPKDGNFPLHDGDIVSIAAILDRFQNAVTLRGNVANPGRYSWQAGMRLSDLFPTRDALITRDYFRKRNLIGLASPDYQPTEGRIAVSTAPTVNATSGQATSATTATGTTIATAPVPPTSSGSGSGATIGDALTQSNSTFTAQNQVLLSAPDVDLAYAVIERQDPVTLVTSLVPFNLGKLVNDHDPSQNLPLFPGDVITVFSKADIRVPSSQQTRFVRLEGEFVQAGLYSVQSGETLRSLIRRAGGLTPDAYLYASEFTRQSTRRIQQQRLQEYADTLEAQIDAQSNQRIANSINPNDATTVGVSAGSARAAVERLRRTQVTGRIVLKITPDSVGVNAIPDLELEDGDRFIVSRQPSTVTVAGQVYNASAFLFTPNLQVRNYLRDAGGPDRFGDRKRTFVIRADGSVVSEQFKHVDKAAILPGDTVVVPPKLSTGTVLQNLITATTLVGPIANAATLATLLTR